MLTGSVHFQVLGTGAFSTPSLVICSDNERLLFDCGDGTQRLCVEQGMKVSKCSRIYLTQTHPEQTGGLGGFLLTRSDLPSNLAQETAVLGPPRTCALIKSFKHFYNRPHCTLNIYEAGSDDFPVRTRDGLEVRPILIGGSSGSRLVEDAASTKRVKAVSPPSNMSGVHFFESHAVLAGEEEELSYAVSYLVRLPERRGKFHPQRALALGITPGKNFGRLTRGEAVFSTKLNRMVTSAECQDEPEQRPVALVLACPTLRHLDALAQRVQEINDPVVQVVFHMTKRNVFEDARYQEFLHKNFAGKNTRHHVALGEGLCPNVTVLPSSCRLQLKLSCVDSDIFPCNEPLSSINDYALPQSNAVALLHQARAKARFHMSPPKQVGYDTLHCVADILPQEEVALAQAVLANLPPASPVPPPRTKRGDIDELLFLGTGSAMPSKYRNVTGMFLRGERNAGGILLDCGEGSLSQLARALGSMQRAREEVHRLAFVWISHIHADHHLGLLAILAERSASSSNSPLLVVGPQALFYFLREFCDSQSGSAEERARFQSSYLFLDCDALLREREHAGNPLVERLKQVANLESAVSVLVPHCHKSYGIVLQCKLGWKLVWSGDTEYCEDLVEEGRGCDILVHEATFEDAKAEEARDKKHSTLATALRVGREMGASTLLFTHFSQRYPKCPPALTSSSGGNGASQMVALFAFDLMHFRPSLAHVLQAKQAQIQGLFAKEEDDEEEEEEEEEMEV